MSTELATPYDLVLQQEEWFKRSLTSDVVTWEKESMFAIQHLQVKDKRGDDSMLLRTARSNLASLQNAIINISAIGISLNPASKHAYLVPRGGMVCLDVSYMGLIHLATKSGSLKAVEAKLVYENDTYINHGPGRKPTHNSNKFSKDKGDIIGVYCTAVTNSTPEYCFVEELDMQEINSIKNKSMAANGPWREFFGQMVRKSAIKRGRNYWPACPELDMAISVINEHEGLTEEYITTAPDINKFSENQKQYFDGLIEESKAVEMYLLNIGIDDSLFGALYHSFKKNTKGKYQKIVDSLVRDGAEIIVADAAALTDALGDDVGSMEIIEGMSKPALNHILDKCLGGEVEMYIRGLIA